MTIPSDDHHNDLVQRLAIGFSALLEQVQDLELRLSRITKESQDFFRPESPLTYSSSLNSFCSQQDGLCDDARQQSGTQLKYIESHEAIGLRNRSRAIWEGRQALDVLNAHPISKMPLSRSQNTQSSQPSAGEHEIDNLKPATHPLNDVNPNYASKCPFASIKTVHDDSGKTWSPYESITPRPDSFTLPQAHHLETTSLNEKTYSDQHEMKEPDNHSSLWLDHQEKLSSHYCDPRSPPHGDLSIEDPIAAECRPTGSCPPPSASGSVSASKCPIRYMDQHSPEEVAAYFENHKHEIPRSHEICVKRYQSNAQSVRQMDAKYGDVVSMIQGLGMKHKPLLPTEDDNEIAAVEQNLLERVGKWTDDIRQTPEESKAESSETTADIRGNHFDRPLKDVRLGESPSRPWGISVPTAKNLSKVPASPTSGRNFCVENIEISQDEDTHSTNIVPKKPTSHLTFPSMSRGSSTTPCFYCPHPICAKPSKSKFSTLRQMAHHILDTHPPEEDQQEHRPPSPTASRPAPVSEGEPPKMIFTGPVFIGYPLDQAAIALQQYGLGSGVKTEH